MATTTARYGLRQPAPIDTADVTTDISTPYGTIDTNLARVDDACLGTQISKWNRQADTSGTIFTTSGGTEVDIPQLAVTGVNVKKDWVYHFKVRVFINGATVANDDYQVKVRTTTALSGAEITRESNFITDTLVEDVITLDDFWIAPADSAAESFHFSVVRALGSGHIDVKGDSRTKLVMWVDPPTVTDTQKVT